MPQTTVGCTHRCLKLLSTMMSVHVDETNTGELGLGGLTNIHRQNFAQWAKSQVNRFIILDFHPKFTLYGHY